MLSHPSKLRFENYKGLLAHPSSSQGLLRILQSSALKITKDCWRILTALRAENRLNKKTLKLGLAFFLNNLFIRDRARIRT